MTALITYEQQQTIKPVSLNNKTRYEQLKTEVQDFELSALFGNVFYQEIKDNYDSSTDDKWKKLVEGATFTTSCGKTLTHVGLRGVLAYLIFAQYVTESYINDTFTGMVQKVRNDSEPISQGAIKNQRQHFRDIAFNYFDVVKKYLCENYTEFDNWNISIEKKRKNFRIVGVKYTR
jgi:hypothetical protein